jgi:hypothetical protein
MNPKFKKIVMSQNKKIVTELEFKFSKEESQVILNALLKEPYGF